MEVLNPIAYSLDRKSYITIYDLDTSFRGLKCHCICPNCNGEYEAKMGDINQWHFAHSGTPCDKTLQTVTSEYLIVQQILLEGEPFHYPGIDGYFAAGQYEPKNVDLIKKNNEMPEALVVDEKFAIRLLLDIDYCVDVISRRYSDLSTISIDCRNYWKLDSVNRREKILLDVEGKQWIYTKKVQRMTDHSKVVDGLNDAVRDEMYVNRNNHRKPYNQPTVVCRLCQNRVHIDDAYRGVCHKCIDSGKVDWRNL